MTDTEIVTIIPKIDLKPAKMKNISELFIEEYLVNNTVKSKIEFCKKHRLCKNTLNKYLNESSINY